ncbi:MAG: hypothetical protein U9N01_01190 [Euryarchaeota archaeon]|nr:hypothetical protein [Euryarchaeota archaeon]
MKEEYKDKTKEQLINDLVELRQRIAELEAPENERKRAEEEEEELHESEEKIRSISASAQDAIIMVNNEGNISYWKNT